MSMDTRHVLDSIILWAPYVITLVTILLSAVKSIKAGKTLEESVLLVVNTLKDENKMQDGKFSQATIDKVERVATVISAGAEAQEKVKAVLVNGEHSDDVKIGSVNGKPLYIGQVVTTGSALLSFWEKIKGMKK